MKRKQFIQHSAALMAASFLTTTKPFRIFSMENTPATFQLPALGYDYSELLPKIRTGSLGKN